MLRLLRPFLLAVAFAPLLSQAASRYTGIATTTRAGDKSRNVFELKVHGSKITGWVASSPLRKTFYVAGTVKKSGAFQLRSRNPEIGGRITGTLRERQIRGAGRLATPRDGTVRVAIAGDTGKVSSVSDDFPLVRQKLEMLAPSREVYLQNLFWRASLYFNSASQTGSGGPGYYGVTIYLIGKNDDPSYSHDGGAIVINHNVTGRGSVYLDSTLGRCDYTFTGNDILRNFTLTLTTENGDRKGSYVIYQPF